jgi:transposase
MMGRLNHDQRQLFCSFSLEEAVPDDHLVRKVAAVLDLSWIHAELAPHYPKNGRPSIDPELMIRMLIIGYVFAIRSEPALCRDVQVNLAYRWFCGLSIEDKMPDHSAFSRARNVNTGGPGRVESDLPMKTKPHFSFRIDIWDDVGDSIVEHVAGARTDATCDASSSRTPP